MNQTNRQIHTYVIRTSECMFISHRHTRTTHVYLLNVLFICQWNNLVYLPYLAVCNACVPFMLLSNPFDRLTVIVLVWDAKMKIHTKWNIYRLNWLKIAILTECNQFWPKCNPNYTKMQICAFNHDVSVTPV